LTCEGLNAQQSGLTEEGWLALASFPLTEITVDEARELQAFVRSCMSPHISRQHQRGLIQVGNQTGYIIEAARRRVADADRREERRREREALEADIARAAREIDAAAQRQAARPPDEQCNPIPYDVLQAVVARNSDRDIRDLLAAAREYTAFRDACDARARRATEEANRKAQEQREREDNALQANPNHFHMHVLEYAQEARSRHAARISATGLAPAFLDAPLNMPVDAVSAINLNLFNTKQLTVAQWLGMLVETHSDIEIGGSRDRWRGGWWITIKFAGERTWMLGAQQDGSEWFVTKVRQGDTEEQVGPDELAHIGGALSLQAGLWKAVRQGGGRTSQ
jgi:hypothetical protein